MKIVQALILGTCMISSASAFANAYLPVQTCSGVQEGGTPISFSVFASLADPTKGIMIERIGVNAQEGSDNFGILDATLTQNGADLVDVTTAEYGTFTITEGKKSSPVFTAKDGTKLALQCNLL